MRKSTICIFMNFVINEKKAMISFLNEPQHDISYNVVCATSKGTGQHAHTGSLIRAFDYCLNILRVLIY